VRIRQAQALVARRATGYHVLMIASFRHKGLRKYFESGSVAGIQPAHAKRLKMQLAALDTAVTIEDMDVPGFRLHPLKGVDKGRWSIWVNGNWRVTFEFEDGNAFILDYEDYH
jgi:proteic killer suppression protein